MDALLAIFKMSFWIGLIILVLIAFGVMAV